MNFNTALLKDGIRRRVQTIEWKVPERVERWNEDPRDPLTGRILDAAIEVHRNLGPGLLPSSYKAALHYELSVRGLHVLRDVAMRLELRGQRLSATAAIPLLVDNEVPVFVHCVKSLQPVHTATVLARLRQGGWRRGLLLNFNVESLRFGIERISL